VRRHGECRRDDHDGALCAPGEFGGFECQGGEFGDGCAVGWDGGWDGGDSFYRGGLGDLVYAYYFDCFAFGVELQVPPFRRSGVDGRCIKSVVLLDINRQRASLILASIFPDSLEVRPLTQIPTPLEISRREKLFVDNRTLSRAEHTADIGVASTAVYNAMKGPTSARNKTIHEIFSNEEYILWPTHTRKKRIHILISLTSPSLKVHFKAWAHAYVLALLLSQSSSRMSSASGGVISEVEVVGGEVKRALELVRGAFEGGIERALGGRGWNVDKSMICVGLEGRGEWRGAGGGEDWTEDVEKRE
jgi:hypothetical protein